MAKKSVGAVLAVSLFMAITRICVILSNMDMNNTQYYLRDDFKTLSFTVVSLLIIVGLLALAYKVGRGVKISEDGFHSTVSVFSCMLAFVLFGSVIIFVASAILDGVVPPINMDALVVFLEIISGVVFLAGGLKKFDSDYYAIFALAPLGMTAVRMLNDFMKTNATPLANSGGYHIVSLVMLTLFFLFGGKVFLGKGNGMAYYFAGYTSLFLLAVYAIPNLFLCCMGMLPFDHSAAFSVVDIVTMVYVASRLSCATLQSKESQNQSLDSVE